MIFYIHDFTSLAYANFKAVIEEYNINITIDEILERYNERHRYFHTPEHLNRIMRDINILEENHEVSADLHNRLVLVTLFHDIVYYPWKTDNELRSAKLFYRVFPKGIDDELRHDVYSAIKATANHANTSELSEVFNKLDFGELKDPNHDDFHELIEYEHKIFKEYQFLPLEDYITHRVRFLQSIKADNKHISQLINYVKNRHYNIGIYPGSFNPFHVGHMNILEKAEKLFDKVIIVKGVNPDKVKSDKQMDELNVQFMSLKEQLPDRETKFVEGNIITKLFVNDPRNPVLIRGLRNGYDLTYEESYLTFCKDYHPELRYTLILCDKQFSHVSSSSIRNIGETSSVGKKYVPQCYTKI